LKESYFLQETQKALYPSKDPNQSTNVHNNSLAASAHVVSAFKSCILELGISEGDANVVMSMLPSIQGIVTADDFVWDTIPIGSREKKIIRSFLCPTQTSTMVDVFNPPPEIKQSWNPHHPTTVSVNKLMNCHNMYSFQTQPVEPHNQTITKSSLEMRRHGKRNFKEFMSRRNIMDSMSHFSNVINQEPIPGIEMYHEAYHPNHGHYEQYPPSRIFPNVINQEPMQGIEMYHEAYHPNHGHYEQYPPSSRFQRGNTQPISYATLPSNTASYIHNVATNYEYHPTNTTTTSIFRGPSHVYGSSLYHDHKY